MPKTRKSKQRRRGLLSSPNASWIRFEIAKPKGRRHRVLIYARYSTDDQNPRSIDAQVSYNKRFLESLGIIDPEITVLFDEGISGEKVFRPDINKARDGIERREWDLISVEDSSRLFRNEMACMEFVGGAVDQGIRVFCINDQVDTADEECWEERLHEAARHHAHSNRFTSKRIKRAHEELWDMRAAIGLLNTGYLRRPTHPATEREPESGPFFDEIDPEQAPTIKEAFQRVAAGESLRSVARWLTSVGLPKAANSRRPDWTNQNVNALIRRMDYRGLQTFRDTVSKKKYRTGERKATRNDPDRVLTRKMPHLRIVPDWLWYKANKAIDDRRRCKEMPRGDEHPLSGVSRESRGPLSGILICGSCGSKVWVDGRIEGGYRCSQVRGGKCWNRTTALRLKTHQWIGEAISSELRNLGERVDGLLERVHEVLDDHGQRDCRRRQLEGQERELVTMLDRLTTAIEQAENEPETIVATVERREAELAQVRCDLEALTDQDDRFRPPSRSEVEDRLGQLIEQLQKMDGSVRDELSGLVGRIETVPYQQFGTDKVVLRARFQINLAAVLPVATRVALMARWGRPIEDEFESIPLLVDLFEPSSGPEYGLMAVGLKADEGLGPTAIGKKLGITKRQANIAVQYGEKLREAGLTDPFIELHEPIAGSRWRTREDHAPEPQRQAG